MRRKWWKSWKSTGTLVTNQSFYLKLSLLRSTNPCQDYIWLGRCCSWKQTLTIMNKYPTDLFSQSHRSEERCERTLSCIKNMWHCIPSTVGFLPFCTEYKHTYENISPSQCVCNWGLVTAELKTPCNPSFCAILWEERSMRRHNGATAGVFV